jgi:hypothetical protein
MESRTVEINVTEQKCDHILSTYIYADNFSLDKYD